MPHNRAQCQHTDHTRSHSYFFPTSGMELAYQRYKKTMIAGRADNATIPALIAPRPERIAPGWARSVKHRPPDPVALRLGCRIGGGEDDK